MNTTLIRKKTTGWGYSALWSTVKADPAVFKPVGVILAEEPQDHALN